MTELDWRTLERIRRQQQPDLRTVQWTCSHRSKEPTDTRGPLPKRTHAHALVKFGQVMTPAWRRAG